MQKNKIFDFADYKEFLSWRIENFPKAGRGQLQKLAAHLSIHPTLVSQVLRGDRNFTSEQTCLVADFFGLNEDESSFLLALVENERAGNSALREYWRRQIANSKEKHRSFSGRIPSTHEMDENKRVQFYSSWEFSGVRLSTSVPDLQSIEAIANRLGLTVKRVSEIAAFLVDAGLCIENGPHLQMGPAWTHAGKDSPTALQHQTNWRLKALQSIQSPRPHEMNITMPMTIALKDREKVKDILLETIEKISRLISTTDPEELCCFSADWFDVRKAPVE